MAGTFLSPKVSIVHDDTKGRCCVASSDIAEGELLATAQPLALELESCVRLSRCRNCLKPADAATPCTGCSQAVYCQRCTALAHAPDSDECQLLQRFTGADAGTVITGRLLQQPEATVQRGQKRTSDGVPKSEELDRFDALAPLTSGQLDIDFAAMPEEIPEDQVVSVAATVAANAHGVTCTSLQDGTVVVGRALIPALSYFNHSCTPNAHFDYTAASALGSVRAVAGIPQGTEITLAYLPQDASPSWARRQALQQQYGFLCDCLECRTGASDPWVAGWRCQDTECECQKAQGPGSELPGCALDTDPTPRMLEDLGAARELIGTATQMLAAGRVMPAKLSLALVKPMLSGLANSHQLVRAAHMCQAAVCSQSQDWDAVVEHATRAIECSEQYPTLCDPLTVAVLRVTRALASSVGVAAGTELQGAREEIEAAHRKFVIHVGGEHEATIEVKHALDNVLQTVVSELVSD